MLFTIQEESVKVHSKGSEDVAGFCAMIHKDFEFEPCYGIVSVDFESSDGRPMNKMCVVSWIPDTASGTQKMLYADTYLGFKECMAVKALPEFGELQAANDSELTVEALLKAAKAAKDW